MQIVLLLVRPGYRCELFLGVHRVCAAGVSHGQSRETADAYLLAATDSFGGRDDALLVSVIDARGDDERGAAGDSDSAGEFVERCETHRAPGCFDARGGGEAQGAARAEERSSETSV